MFSAILKLFGLGRSAAADNERNGAAPLRSFVWLLEEPRRLTHGSILILARRALGKDLLDVHELPQSPNLPGNMFVVTVRPRIGLGIISAHKPYVEDPQAHAVEVDEGRRSALLSRHRAWLAVDLMTGSASKAGYRAIGKLLAALAGSDCLLLYSTESGRLEPFHDDLPRRLEEEGPVQALSQTEHPSVINCESDDPELLAAIAEAERRWPEFVQAFRSNDRHTEHFSVKAPFDTSDGDIEWMWVAVESIEGEKITGRVANDPVNVPGVQEGDLVEIERERIQDWLYVKRGKMIGGFTSQVLAGK